MTKFLFCNFHSAEFIIILNPCPLILDHVPILNMSIYICIYLYIYSPPLSFLLHASWRFYLLFSSSRKLMDFYLTNPYSGKSHRGHSQLLVYTWIISFLLDLGSYLDTFLSSWSWFIPGNFYFFLILVHTWILSFLLDLGSYLDTFLSSWSWFIPGYFLFFLILVHTWILYFLLDLGSYLDTFLSSWSWYIPRYFHFLLTVCLSLILL